jgi:hypothetical protein
MTFSGLHLNLPPGAHLYGEHCTNVSPFVEGSRQFQSSLYSCLYCWQGFFLVTGSSFFKLSPRLGMLPLICHMILDHQIVCEEHRHTIIIKHLNDKDSVLRSVMFHKKQKYLLPMVFFCNLLV